MRTKLLGMAAAFIPVLTLGAQPHISAQAHRSPVTALAAPCGGRDGAGVFSAGADGFLVKWAEDGMGEHYQLTELAVRMVARSPDGNSVAVYETDGAAVNRVSIWDWRTLTRRHSFRFPGPITALAFSARGTYLLCGTAAVRGLTVISAANGSILSSKIKEDTGAVGLARTSQTENTAVLYSPAGSLTYYDLKTGARKARFAAESALSQVCLFGNDVFAAGVKDDGICVIQATTGQTAARYGARRPLLAGEDGSGGLLYLTQENRALTLHAVRNERNRLAAMPQELGTFTGLRQDETVTSAAAADGVMYAGTSLGNVYRFAIPESPADGTLDALTNRVYEPVSDVAGSGAGFYFLTSSAVFRSSYDDGAVEKAGENPGHTGLLAYGTDVILWSKDTARPVQRLDTASGALTTLFTPRTAIQTLRLRGDALVFIEGNATVSRYDIASGTREQLYLGAGLQDALLASPTDLYVAKSSATGPAAPLLHVDTETKETVPLSLRGDIAYALSLDEGSGALYGIVIATGGGKTTTSLFRWDARAKAANTFLPAGDEDGDSFTCLAPPLLYTSVGKGQVHGYNLGTRRDLTYRRGASLPRKAAQAGKRLAVLNRDGSISWYDPALSAPLADWYLTADGQWLEF